MRYRGMVFTYQCQIKPSRSSSKRVLINEWVTYKISLILLHFSYIFSIFLALLLNIGLSVLETKTLFAIPVISWEPWKSGDKVATLKKKKKKKKKEP